jgi:hypothetical protein
MKLLHTKSPCCGAPVRRFGERRRDCALCRRTWRVHLKKRGRKKKRTRPDIISRYLKKRLPPLRVIAAQRGCSKDAVQTELHRSLKRYVKKHHSDWQELVAGHKSLIAVADAIWYRIQGERYTIYVILLRPKNLNQAVICPPLVIPGHECVASWRQAFESLPPEIKSRIIALICDGGSGLIVNARSYHWLIQRCHFHLLAAVQNYLTTGPRSARLKYALTVMKTVRDLLQTNDESSVRQIIGRLKKIFEQSNSRGLRRVIGGLMTNYVDYHTCLNYPELHLPTTSNSAESFIQCLRDLMYRCRGFRSLASLNDWLLALTIFKKTIRCEGKNQPN